MKCVIRSLSVVIGIVWIFMGSTASCGEVYYVKAAVDARAFMPKNFRNVLTKYNKDLVRGALLKNPRGEKWNVVLLNDKQQASEIIEQEAIFIIEAIRARKHFSEVTYHFGVISHYLSDTGMPLRGADLQPYISVEEQFTNLMDAQLDNFRILFNGYDDIANRKNAFATLALTMMNEKIPLEKQLADQFVKNGTIVNYRAFDTRSIPFGIASIVYSRTVNNIVDCWYSIWKTAGGDYNQRPFEKN